MISRLEQLYCKSLPQLGPYYRPKEPGAARVCFGNEFQDLKMFAGDPKQQLVDEAPDFKGLSATDRAGSAMENI
jgi:hypothetical protein